MKRSTDRILTTHVGSLVRPPAAVEAMWAIENPNPMTADGAHASWLAGGAPRHQLARPSLRPLDVLLQCAPGVGDA